MNRPATGFGFKPDRLHRAVGCMDYRAGHIILNDAIWACRGCDGTGTVIDTDVERRRDLREPVNSEIGRANVHDGEDQVRSPTDDNILKIENWRRETNPLHTGRPHGRSSFGKNRVKWKILDMSLLRWVKLTVGC